MREKEVGYSKFTYDCIIIISGLRWNFLKQRIHNLAISFKNHLPVIFVEPHYDLIQVCRAQFYHKGGFSFYREEEGIHILSSAVPFKMRKKPTLNDWIEKKFVYEKISKRIEDLLKEKGFNNPILLTTDPSHIAYLSRLNYKVALYDCADDLVELCNNRIPNLAENENKLMRSVDIVTVTATELMKKARLQNENVVLVNNGVKPEVFSLPFVKQEKEKIVIGYVGAMLEECFDAEIIEKLAEKYSEAEIHLIGPVGFDNDFLKSYKNIKFLGPKTHAELPFYMEKFDVCIIPFFINKLTNSVNPVKLFEYLATGKPIISSALPEVKKYEDDVYIAHSYEDWINLIEKAIQEDSEERYNHRVQIAMENSWNNRVEKILQYLNKFI